jgi:hypothetical protein
MLRDLPGIRWPRAGLFGLLILLHAAVLLLPPETLRLSRGEPLALIYLPAPDVSGRGPPRRTANKPVPSRKVSSQAAPSLPIRRGQSGASDPTTSIDWDREASITAENQALRANESHPRSLDDHRGHGDHQDGIGLSSREPIEFGWDQTAIHRFDTRGEIPIIRLSDRCVLPLSLGPFIPLPWCGFGKKIEARGDLFEHMRDAPAAAQRQVSGEF